MEETAHQAVPGILFVDDEENILRSLVRLFADEDYSIRTAASGAEGLEIVQGNEIAVVVSDQGMPQMRGAEFLERVKEASPDTVRIVLTGYADLNAAIEAINKGGAFQYITKPWDDDNLILSVRMAAERYNLVRENRYLTELTHRQNEELKRWSAELELDVQQQTIELTHKNKELVDINERLERNFHDFGVTISNLIELRDKTVANHSNNVSVLSREIAKKIGLDQAEVAAIAIAAQLHDIGKIGIPDMILLKDADRLEPHEVREYRKHPVRGQASVDANETLREAGRFIRSHHESMNGEGFPDGLKGDKIPLGSRIIAIADRYDRLLATRPPETALEELRSLTGTQFDRNLYYPLAEVAKEMMSAAPLLHRKRERELHPGELMPDMVLSREVRSGTGVLLLSKGVRLDTRRIDSIRRHLTLDPPESGTVHIWMDAGER